MTILLTLPYLKSKSAGAAHLNSSPPAGTSNTNTLPREKRTHKKATQAKPALARPLDQELGA